MLRVAVLGGKFGEYHAREFKNAHCKVVAVMARSEASSKSFAKLLEKKYTVQAIPYYDFEALITEARPDIISVCTSPQSHVNFAALALEKGIHTLCEKPFSDELPALPKLHQIYRLAHKQKCHFALQLQWAAVASLLSHHPLTHFEAYGEPKPLGEGMLWDFLPHFNSLLIALAGTGVMNHFEVVLQEEDRITLSFTFRGEKCSPSVIYHFRQKTDRPGALVFTINGIRYERQIGDQYDQYFLVNNKKIAFADPLALSIQNFVAVAQGTTDPLLNEQQTLCNVALTDQQLLQFRKP